MDGLARSVSPPWPCRWGGKTYWAEPMRLWAIGSAELFILIQRESLLDKVSRLMEALEDHPEMGKELYDRAYGDMKKDKESRMVTMKQMEEWLNTRPGIAYAAWCCLRNARPHDCLEDVEEQVNRMKVEELLKFNRALSIASGTDAMGNMDWRSKADIQKLRPKGRTGRSDENGPKYMPWRKIFRQLSTSHGWGPSEIGQLTLYQTKMYMAEEEEIGGGTKSMSPDEAASFMAQMRAKNGG